MSTLEKTIDLLNTLSENQIETIYSYVQFLTAQQKKESDVNTESLQEILGNIVGAVQDQGKSLKEYKAERIADRYEAVN
jgi:effector-binding domain-containing protein